MFINICNFGSSGDEVSGEQRVSAWPNNIVAQRASALSSSMSCSHIIDSGLRLSRDILDPVDSAHLWPSKVD
jgi:hypothetical protein